MITDPATSPAGLRNQVVFGVAVAALYAVAMELNLVFGMFYALTLVTLARGLWFARGTIGARTGQAVALIRRPNPTPAE
jgi:hypothetical protein